MQMVCLPRIGTVAAWRRQARRLLQAGVPGENLVWQTGEPDADLFAAPEKIADADCKTPFTLTKSALTSIETALHHKDPERFARAYDIVARLASGRLRWGDRSDKPLHCLLGQEKAVRRDIHKMHAFVRFREVGSPDAARRAFAAWFEPDHPIAEAACPFFASRFGDMDWIIATPSLTARFENGTLSYEETRNFSPPPEDATEDLWRTYFANIFNPARLMVSAMTSEMPRKYWKNLPEASLIPGMIRTAPERALAMQLAMPTEPSAFSGKVRPMRPAPPDDGNLSLDTLKPALDACRRCTIGSCATQAVPGEGPSDADLMIVGEQPGDIEDLTGRPFVGPAGQLFDSCAEEAGLDRTCAFLTNAVKHFKFTPRGKRRLHNKPNAGEVVACRWWLDFERRAVKPKLLLAMGSSATLSLTGSGESLLQRRGTVEKAEDGTPVLITYHPSYLLRLREETQRRQAKSHFIQDLRQATSLLRSHD
ncbi:UdgX family uracil-DNA binding protein [uncultured Roseibium sp.]|uniref:UdgX family uracil-DNA binding protein n=1 Tax=uncultured Roseibium sp. TaxID=1936171 RepID=UPI00262035DA|nr:UdgX family uracil-DNA binding protein [uncultured Roseibium sp.]